MEIIGLDTRATRSIQVIGTQVLIFLCANVSSLLVTRSKTTKLVFIVRFEDQANGKTEKDKAETGAPDASDAATVESAARRYAFRSAPDF